jgi:hypothetical protein
MFSKNGQGAAPGRVLAHYRIKVMGSHEMVSTQRVLSLEQSLIALALTLALTYLGAMTLPPWIPRIVAKSTFLAVPKMGGSINFFGKVISCGNCHDSLHSEFPLIKP